MFYQLQKKNPLYTDLHRQGRGQKLCHVGKENNTPIAVRRLPVNQQWVNQDILGFSKENKYFSFHSMWPMRMEATVLCV